MGFVGGGRRNFQPDIGELRFIWLTDSHNITTPTAIRDDGVRGALADANAWRADAVVHTGDIGDNQAANVAAAFALLRGTAISCPLIFCIGNHDEYEATPGTPNTSTIEGASYFNMAAPFYHTGTLTAANGTLTAIYLCLDCNIYDDDPAHIIDSPNHTPGDRIGYHTSEPAGGYYRQFGATQRAWIASTLAADTTSQLVLIFVHYPFAGQVPTDWRQVADLFQADGRATAIFFGHNHSHARTTALTTTDNRKTYTGYETFAGQQSGAWTRVRVRVSGTVARVDELTIKNYTPVDGWDLNAPFVVV